MTETLFPDLEPAVPPPAEPVEKLSAGRRLTLRQKHDIAVGRHPLLPGRKLLGNGETCGTCAHRSVERWHDRSYPKCEYRVTHGPASDCRAWWPACSSWDPVTDDPKVSPDAARWKPA